MIRLFAILVLLWALPLGGAGAAEFLTFDDALRLAFPDSGKVERFRPEVSEQQQRTILEASRSRAEAKLGGIYVGHSDGRVDGIAFVDHVIGRTEYITWLCVLTPAGAVRRIEVMAYREPYGDEIRDRAFLAQFEGKEAASPLRTGREVANIIGATLSVNALTDRVRFLLAFHDVALKGVLPAWLMGRESPPRRSGDRTLVERSAPIGNAALTVRLVHAGHVDQAAAEAGLLLDEAARLDALFNPWRDEAELARINRAGGGVASSELFALLVLARRCFELSGGRFDPTIFPLLTLWKRSAESGVAPDAAALALARSQLGFQRVTLDSASRRVQLPQGMALDLSGLNKGAMLDRCGAGLAARLKPGQAALLAHGDSSWLAVAQDAAADHASLFTIALRHPLDPQRLHQRLTLRAGQALGSASSSGRTLVIAGVAHSHLIDPLSGEPAPMGRSATVLAESAGLADGLDTALCLMPPAEALALVATLPGVSALLWDGERFHASPTWPGVEVGGPAPGIAPKP
jgi:thiamine biosynthesis lipoprotein